MEFRTKAYRLARQYMRDLNRPCDHKHMSEADKKLFRYVRIQNVAMLKCIK